MNFLLFLLEIIVVMAGIASVPAQSELRISRSRDTYNEREREKYLRS
jgi:hypothetical protein